MRCAGTNAAEAPDLQKKCKKTKEEKGWRGRTVVLSWFTASIETMSFLSSESTGKAVLLSKEHRHNEIIKK